MIICPANTSADMTAMVGNFLAAEVRSCFSSLCSSTIEAPATTAEAAYITPATAGVSNASAICMECTALSLRFL